MANNIAIELSIDGGEIDAKKVEQIVMKFSNKCEKVGANVAEIGAAISVLQKHYFDAFGMLPMNGDLLKLISDTDVYVEG